jgi:hypothetical protein
MFSLPRIFYNQFSGNKRRPASRQRPPRRPNVKRRNMPMPHVLLVYRVQRSLLQGKGMFDEAGTISSHLSCSLAGYPSRWIADTTRAVFSFRPNESGICRDI